MRLRDLAISGALAIGAVAALAVLLIHPASEEDQVADTLARYQDAVAEEDVQTICDDLTVHHGTSSAECQRDLRPTVGRPGFQDAQEDLEFAEAHIRAPYARVRTEPNGGFLELIQEDGNWKLVILQP